MTSIVLFYYFSSTSVGLDGCIREVQLVNERNLPEEYNEDYNPLVKDATAEAFISGSAGYYTTCHSKVSL